MRNKNSTGNSYLDNMRLNEGDSKCTEAFGEVYGRDKSQAAALLNDKRLKFPCFFILLPQIKAFDLYKTLNLRSKTTLKIIDEILTPEDTGKNTGLLSKRNESEYAALKWMLVTGYDDNLRGDYEEILDAVVSVLINIYKDRSVLLLVSDMIFLRCRNKRNYHNLASAFFMIRDPFALKLVAKHIDSAESEEAKLARFLLGIDEYKSSITGVDPIRQDAYLKWVEENSTFIHFTGESFQLTSMPVFFNVDLERKYVQKSTSHNNMQQDDALAVFNTLGKEDKEALSDYSYRIRSRNPSEWRKWISKPIEEQIETAKTGGRTL